MRNKKVSTAVVCVAAVILSVVLFANSLARNTEKINRDAYRYHLEYLTRAGH